MTINAEKSPENTEQKERVRLIIEIDYYPDQESKICILQEVSMSLTELLFGSEGLIFKLGRWRDCMLEMRRPYYTRLKCKRLTYNGRDWEENDCSHSENITNAVCRNCQTKLSPKWHKLMFDCEQK